MDVTNSPVEQETVNKEQPCFSEPVFVIPAKNLFLRHAERLLKLEFIFPCERVIRNRIHYYHSS